MGRRWNFARIALLVLGCLGVLVAIGLLSAGGFGLWADQSRRDSDGFLSTRHESFESSGYALVSESVDISTEGPDWVFSEDVLGEVRLRAESASGKDVFIGIGPEDDVEAYLGSVERDVVRDFEVDPFRVEYRNEPGGAPGGPPGDQAFWAAAASGPGEQTLLWEVEGGDWSIVVMNADASQDVAVSLSVGAEANFLLWLSIGLLILGALVLLGSVLLIYLAARGGAAVVDDAPAGALALAPDYPVGVRGTLDPDLSRWLWVVKWILAIPHYIVLALLWIAFFVLSVVAFFAILFTGRYPRGIFDFNTGVIRWTWRVMFYSYWALGTDRYPPFTLGHVPDYPASVHIAYPEGGLSRGLVLVKWWLLAIPQYILVGLFVGGWWWGPWWLLSCGLIGLLVIFAGLSLVFRARYPLGIFDLVLGLDRWVLRVVAYAGLMTDRYPPFRLDQGPDEPAPRSQE